MGIMNKVFGDKKSGDVEGYVDLEKYVESTGGVGPASMYVRVGEIQRIGQQTNVSGLEVT